MASRNRAAPGAPSTIPQQSVQSNLSFPSTQEAPPLTNDSYVNWDDASGLDSFDNNYDDANPLNTNFYLGDLNAPMSREGGAGPGAEQNQSSGQLVRRSNNQQLATRSTNWQDYGGTGGRSQSGVRSNNRQDYGGTGGRSQSGVWENTDDDDEDLEAKAIVARKEAQAKRKQIPPFVQKLSSFLDEKRNTDLIRWSDDGTSFIVLNEDEFAKTLIPELFKHNNYASFVRQLNMYGFHKKVGLSDNSMRQSETKVKNPSEYFNKYFRRSRPELLWLIQKPKNASSSGKRKRPEDKGQGQGDSDDDGQRDRADGNDRDESGNNPQSMAMIPTRELDSLKSELRAVQNQQRVISTAIQRIRHQNDQLYQQATAFQTLHDRHENSINAILTFLATFYNRSLESQNGQNIADMFTHAINSNQQSRRNVVDVGDLPDIDLGRRSPVSQQRKRPLALLPAPPDENDLLSPTPKIETEASTPQPGSHNMQSDFAATENKAGDDTRHSANRGTIDSNSTRTVSQTPENQEIMSAIQNANATNKNGIEGSTLDFPAALSHFQNADGNSPLTPQQRNSLLSMIAQSAPAPTSTDGNSDNNALVSPNPPPMPSMDTFSATQAQLDLLQKMQEEQNSKVQSLAERLQPLSPSGAIPGFEPPSGSSYFGTAGVPGDFDLNNYVNSDDYFTDLEGANGSDVNAIPDLTFDFDTNNTNPGRDFDFNVTNDALDNSFNLGDDLGNTGGRVESVSSAAASPANAGEDATVGQGPTIKAENGGRMQSPKKRRIQ